MSHFFKIFLADSLRVSKYLISFIVAVILGLNIYHRCDAPPYGYPLNELSDCYWGAIIDIANHWRNFDIEFWSRSLAGGVSMFTTGWYPVFNPTNVFSLVLNDDQFYLFKLIEPYVMGFFFMSVLLWDEFKTKWYIAFFGGMAYMGLLLSKTFSLAASPYLLYACGLFPAMALVAIKLLRRHVYLAAAGVGALLALQFLGQGSTQTPQMLVWWAMFFMVFICSFWLKQKNGAILKTGLIALIILVVASVGLCAVQMLPSFYYFKYESARQAGYYPINNFNLFYSKQDLGFLNIFWIGLINAGPIRSKAFVVLALMSLALAVKYFGRIFEKTPNRIFLYLLWITLAIYFCFPGFAFLLTKIFPFFTKAFSMLTYFTFKYALFTFDFAMILTVCLILNDDGLSLTQKTKFVFLDTLAWIILCLAVVAAALPLFFALSQNSLEWLKSAAVFHYFVPETQKNACNVLVKAMIFVLFFALRPKQKVFQFIVAVVLLSTSFMMMLDCFKWYDKGQRSNPQLYQIDSPEQVYYTKAKGKYLLPWQDGPDWVMHNYNLLYGVHGTSGFLGAAPRRLTRFMFYYVSQGQNDWRTTAFSGKLTKFGAFGNPTPAALTTYFPADFTLVPKAQTLDWPGFAKTVFGDVYDVYERQQPAALLHVARQLKVVDFFDLVEKFNVPRADTVFVAREDARLLNIEDKEFVCFSDPEIRNFQRPSADNISFESFSREPFYAIIPESYSPGWRVKMDGKNAAVFPAYYLFNGVKVPSGQHQIRMVFVPKGFVLGLVINLFSIAGMGILFAKFWPRQSLR